MKAPRLLAAALLVVSSGPGMAHGFAGAGWIHPLTGTDHMLAMVAVGLWSAQLGGRAIWSVPAAFVVAMAIGSTFGLLHWPVQGIEAIIALTVVAVGLAMALESRLAWPIAAAAALVFGLAHGYVHGLEMPDTHRLGYAAGFLATTAGLHVAGAVAGLLVLERPDGQRLLRAGGALVAAAGGALLQAAL